MRNNVVYVYMADTDISEEVYSKIYEYLTPERRQSADSKMSREARNESAVSFYLLVMGLIRNGVITDAAEMKNLGYSKAEHGKPYFANRSDIHFSISHTNGRVVCAIACAPVGCDIECKKRKITDMVKLAERFYNEDEIRGLHNIANCADNDTASKSLESEFYRIWTAKESYVKLSGEGMNLAFDSFNIDLCQPNPKLIYEDDKYSVSVCCEIEDIVLEDIVL